MYLFTIILFTCHALRISGLANTLTYSDLEDLNKDCYPKDSCQILPQNNNITERHCMCDRDCGLFQDCCIDAPTRTSSHTLQVSCMPYGKDPDLGAYVVGRCPKDYLGPNFVSRNCHYQTGYRDPILSVPVTDVTSHVTYRNRYCAQCNNVSPESLVSWLIYVKCESLETTDNDDLWDQIRYDEDVGRWGVDHDDYFHTCKLVFDLPEDISSYVRLCRANVISSCSRNWNLRNGTRNCAEYMALVYSGDSTYRNVHCALCNYKRMDEIFCISGITSKRKPFSFALLLDVNTRDGERVGFESQCSRGERYDPFFKKCRRVKCAFADHVMRNGRCVNE